MHETASLPPMRNLREQDRRIGEVFAREGARLRNFIRRRVPDAADVEDLVQEVFAELVEANRLMMPVEHVVGWLFQVARNRITDLFRKRGREPRLEEALGDGEEGRLLLAELLPSRDGTPEDAYARAELLDAISRALAELPAEQRQVFLAHEVAGKSFKEIAARTGVNVNTLLARKRYAVLHLRRRLERTYSEWYERYESDEGHDD